MEVKNKKGKNDKFKLVQVEEFDSEELTEEEYLNSKKDIAEKEIIKEEKKEIEPKTEEKEKIAFSEIEDNKSQEEELDNPLPTKPHIGFEIRVAIMIIFIVVFFAAACYLILEAINFGEKESVSYQEKSTASYQVCSNQTPPTCYNEGLQYSSPAIKNINVNLNYNVDFSTDIAYDLSYYIVSTVKVVDADATLLYSNEENLVEKKQLKDNGNNISINEKINLDYDEYNQTVRLYTRDRENAKATVTLKMIVVDSKEERKVTTLEIPLQQESFTISSTGTDNSDFVEVNNNEWNNYNSICAGIASVLIIVSLILVYRVTHLIIKVTTNHNEYQEVLADILREYDRIIVIARDGYESNIAKETVKVETFEELLDARDVLEKPIIYSKINDIKSEFIVEDDDKLYKFTLKESDVMED